MNRVQLSASIADAKPLRYTPAGLPALDLRLAHQSNQDEAGFPRQVTCSIRAVAFATLAERLARQPLDSEWQFTGFLATPRNGKHPVLHIQDFQQVQPHSIEEAHHGHV